MEVNVIRYAGKKEGGGNEVGKEEVKPAAEWVSECNLSLGAHSPNVLPKVP